MEFVRSLRQIADLVFGDIEGDSDTLVTGVSAIAEAAPGDLVFAETPKYLEMAVASRATAVMISRHLPSVAGKPAIRVENARVAFAAILGSMSPTTDGTPGIHPLASVSEEAVLGAGVTIGPCAHIGAGAELAEGVWIGAGCSIGTGCRVGTGTKIYPNVVVYPRVTIGARCIIHAGAVIGADGFGYVPLGTGLARVPHIGSVRIDDDVEIGANTCIDRAKTGETVIGSGTKLDNLVHVAHSVRIGRNCIVIAQVGIAGSVTVGDGVVLAGQAGIADHLTIGDGARVAAQGGVIGNVNAGETVSGYPARRHAVKMREHAAVAALPEALRKIRTLEKRLAALEERVSTDASSIV